MVTTYRNTCTINTIRIFAYPCIFYILQFLNGITVQRGTALEIEILYIFKNSYLQPTIGY